jgi:hypothetical protein
MQRTKLLRSIFYGVGCLDPLPQLAVESHRTSSKVRASSNAQAKLLKPLDALVVQ